MVMGPFLYEELAGGPEHYLHVYRVITILEKVAAGATPYRYPFGTVHYLLGLIEGEQVAPFYISTIGISHQPDQITYHW